MCVLTISLFKKRLWSSYAAAPSLRRPGAAAPCRGAASSPVQQAPALIDPLQPCRRREQLCLIFERRCATLRAAAGTASWLTDLSTLRAEIAATLMELRVSKVEMDKFEEECARGRKEVLMSTKSGTRTIHRQQESFRKQQIAAWQARIRKLRGSAKRWESEAELKLEIDGVRVLVWAKSESGKRKAIRANNLSTKAVAMSSARRVLVAADENVRVPVKEAEKDKVEPEAVGGFWG